MIVKDFKQWLKDNNVPEDARLSFMEDSSMGYGENMELYDPEVISVEEAPSLSAPLVRFQVINIADGVEEEEE